MLGWQYILVVIDRQLPACSITFDLTRLIVIFALWELSVVDLTLAGSEFGQTQRRVRSAVDTRVVWRLMVGFETRDVASAEWLREATGLSDRTLGLCSVGASGAPSIA
jgi:hypothetical protein